MSPRMSLWAAVFRTICRSLGSCDFFMCQARAMTPSISADFFVVSVPSNADTVGMVNVESFAAMRASAVIMNVGRGPTIDEQSLYAALKDRRIAGAVIDTWYNYPSPDHRDTLPSKFPFHELPNV